MVGRIIYFRARGFKINYFWIFLFLSYSPSKIGVLNDFNFLKYLHSDFLEIIEYIVLYIVGRIIYFLAFGLKINYF